MTVAIPYRHSYGALELKYCLRGIEKFIEHPEIIIIANRLPKWLNNITHIPYKDTENLKWKERNIYEKIMQVNDDFIFFNDDHFLLQPFNFEYHYSGTLLDQVKEYKEAKNPFFQTLLNTSLIHGNIKNYYRHQPIFIEKRILNQVKIFSKIDWTKEWGYCIKSLYCFLVTSEKCKEYPDLKIRMPTTEKKILELIKGRQYFSTENGAMNRDMARVLESIYPVKSTYEF
jgi:hypothetical protein